jgi:hypothetical protein
MLYIDILLQFNALKCQLSMQCYEPYTTSHVVRKLLMPVVVFGTTIPNRPSIITLFGCFWYLDFQINDLYYIQEGNKYSEFAVIIAWYCFQ